MKPKKTAREFVSEFEATLKSFKSSKELYLFAKDNGYAGSAAAFSAFKKALLSIGIDYDALKQQRVNELQKELEAKAKAELILYSDASYSRNRFAICNKDGYPVYYGNFYFVPSSQADAELEAAKKALWVAQRVKYYNKLDGLKLTLYVDAEWLTYQDNKKQKGFVLTEIARKDNILLEVKHVYGKDNPADVYTQLPDGQEVELYQKLDVESEFLKVTQK